MLIDTALAHSLRGSRIEVRRTNTVQQVLTVGFIFWSLFEIASFTEVMKRYP